ncbi:MAG: PDZ domain-containing protein [Bacteroidota bacterium]
MNNKRILLGLAMLWGSVAFAQETLLLRQPTLHNDKIVFVYANDLWRVSSDGGDAYRLTSNEGAETRPHYSPDGNWVAFSGQYDGNTDVYIVAANGGEPKRLTWHPGQDKVTGWTPDGDVLFVSGRLNLPTQEERFFSVSPEGGMPTALEIPRAAEGELSADGKYAAYQMVGFWDPEWRNYRGGQAKPIWIVDMKNYSLVKTPQPDGERHTDPVWHDGKVYYLSERDYANNIWMFDPASGTEQQMTKHADFDVKSLDAGPGGIVYEQGGRLHRLNPGTGNSTPLAITVKGDFHWARDRWEDIRAQSLSNPAVSPTGKRALFEYRGEIFSVPKENGNWRNLTQSSSSAERYPAWSPEGDKIAWFTDASGEYQLVIADQEGEVEKTIAIDNPTFFFQPQWSPDGKYIAFTDTDYNLYYTDVESGTTKRIDTDGYAHPNRTLNPVWSPDSRWIAYVRLEVTQYKTVKAHNIESGETLSLTDGMADCLTPVWDESGKYLYFLASTDYGLNTGWLDMSSYNQPITRALYMIVLDKDTEDPLAPMSDEEPVETDDEEESDEEEEEFKVTIDMEGIGQRTIALEVPSRNYIAVWPGPEGTVFYGESVPNQPGITLHKYSISDREGNVFMSGLGGGVVSHDRKTLLYYSSGSWGMASAAGGSAKPGDGRLNTNMRLKISPQQEWKQIYKEGWRFMRDFLYVDNVHGAPWDDVYGWYAPWIDHVRHRSDLNYVVDIMSGEVAIGHSYTYGGDYPDVEYIPVGLLGADFEKTRNGYQIKKIYTGENWNPNVSAPLSGPGINVEEGQYLVAVNGEEVSTNRNLYSYFEATAGRQVKILVNDRARMEGATEYTVVPVSNEFQLRRWDWIEGNRKKVAELSDNQLAYVYVPNTGGQGYQYFNRYYFAQQDKVGAVIDERNNGGGSAADYMVDVMARDLQGYFNSKAGDRRPWTVPMAGIWGPKVMLMNERSGSGGDLLPFLFRQMEIGPLIGTLTWGGLVGTWDTPPFVDNGRMVAPRGGFFDLDGEWAVEGEGVAPDIEVIQTPADVIAGKDPQLERAVQEALKLLETERVELKKDPADPIRYRRPSGN